MKQGAFRLWLQNLWFENRDEHEQYGELPMPLEEYFQRYKWWLKREYKFQQQQSK